MKPKERATHMWSTGTRYDVNNTLLQTTWGLGIDEAKVSVAGCSVWGNHCFALYTIQQFGDSLQKQQFSPVKDLNEASTLSFVLTELTGGSNLSKIKTTIRLDKDEQHMVLDTSHDSPKDYIGNGTTNYAVVLARMITHDGKDRGLVWLIVDNRLPGVSISPKENCHAVHGLDVCRIEYKSVHLSCQESLLKGSVGLKSADLFSTFKLERIAVSSMAVGVVQKWITKIQERHRDRFPASVEIRNTFRNRYERWRGICGIMQTKAESLMRDFKITLCHATLFKICLTWMAKECMGELRELGGAAAMFKDFGIKNDEAEIDLMCTFAGDNSILCLYIMRKFRNIRGWRNRIRGMRLLSLASNAKWDVMVLAKAYVWLCMYDLVDPKEKYIQEYFKAKISLIHTHTLIKQHKKHKHKTILL
jgi:alkylation response protein AidB-like acyl-CoA dehydrogenase